MHVGYDADGVFQSFHAGCNAFLKMEGHVGIKAEQHQWDFFLEWPEWDKKQFWKFVKRGVEAGVIFNTPPFRGAVEAFNSVKAAGHKVHIITARPDYAEGISEKWFRTCGFDYDSLTFSLDKTVVPTDMYVDDKPSNIDALLKAGTDAYLLSRPWNKNYTGYKRVRSVGEFSRKVLSIPVD